MSSISAQNVANDVLQTIRKNQKVKLGKIIVKNGYSEVTSKSPTVVTKTKSYQKVVRPLVEQLERERQAIMDRLPKVRGKAKYRDLMDGLDKITKTHQLLTGGATENVAVQGVTIKIRK